MPVRSGIFFNFRREKSTAFERKYTKDENISPRYFTISAVLKKYSTCRSFICDIKTLTWLSTRKNTFHLSLSLQFASLRAITRWICIATEFAFSARCCFTIYRHISIYIHIHESKSGSSSRALSHQSRREQLAA